MSELLAWLDCPYQRRNDPYPGLCNLYVDSNQNQICDHSEPSPSSSISVAPAAKAMKDRPFWGTVSDLQGVSLLIFLSATIYFIHWYLSNKTNLGKRCGFFAPAGFKYFWNLMLLLTFVPTGILGLLLAMEIKSVALASWHKDLGIIFVTIGFIHFISRFRYFKDSWKRIFKTA
jgi:hypothetical protein